MMGEYRLFCQNIGGAGLSRLGHTGLSGEGNTESYFRVHACCGGEQRLPLSN